VPVERSGLGDAKCRLWSRAAPEVTVVSLRVGLVTAPRGRPNAADARARPFHRPGRARWRAQAKAATSSFILSLPQRTVEDWCVSATWGRFFPRLEYAWALTHTPSVIFLILPERSGIVRPVPPKKNPAAVALGRLGGKRGGPARRAALTREQRAESARRAARARWGKKSQARGG